ncbi:MAG: hypothetical protein ACT4TC_14675 [Myxococcaceae bacterium]
MFRTLKFLVWTACAVGFGLYLSTFQFDGKSTASHAGRIWKQQTSPSTWRVWKSKLGDFWNEAEEVIPAATPKPKEHHSNEDRNAVDKLIATHGSSQKG